MIYALDNTNVLHMICSQLPHNWKRTQLMFHQLVADRAINSNKRDWILFKNVLLCLWMAWNSFQLGSMQIHWMRRSMHSMLVSIAESVIEATIIQTHCVFTAYPLHYCRHCTKRLADFGRHSEDIDFYQDIKTGITFHRRTWVGTRSEMSWGVVEVVSTPMPLSFEDKWSANNSMQITKK